MRELDDPLAEVRLERLDAFLGEAMVDLHLFGDHALALRDEFRALLLGDFEHDARRLRGVGREMHVLASRLHRAREAFEVVIEVLDHVLSHAPALFAILLPAAERASALVLSGAQPLDREAHRPAQEIVRERLRRAQRDRS